MDNPTEKRVTPPDSASARQTEMGDKFNRVLFSALDALQERSIPYALIGGIAASGLGRPRSTHDIDIFVRPEDADATLEALAAHNFETERTDARWLYKGWKESMMVDVIFKSQGDIYLDDEMYRHARAIQYHGRSITAVSPEDLIIIKAAVHSEVGPHHWHDALAILSHAQMDWHYLLKRARRAPRRILSLLVYAQSNDILIPNAIIAELVDLIFGQSVKEKKLGEQVPPPVKKMQAANAPSTEGKPRLSTQTRNGPDLYLLGHIHEALASDERTATLDVQCTVSPESIFIKGEVPSATQRQAIDEILKKIAVGYRIDNRVEVMALTAPQAEEVV